MRYLVLVKQVPEINSVHFVPQLNRIERDGVAALLNPLDRDALEHALAMREATGGELVAVTMGPPGARAVLLEALELGADRAIHLLDLAFAGADSLATARALAAVVARERPDAVLCGRSTLDGATAQVGPQLAELSGLAQITQVVEIALEGTVVRAVRELESGRQFASARLPVLVTVERGPLWSASALSIAPRRDVAVSPNVADKIDEIDEIDEIDKIDEIDAAGLGGDPGCYGIRGSGTYVQQVMEAVVARHHEVAAGAIEGAQHVVALATGPTAAVPVGPPAGAVGTADADPVGLGGPAQQIWVVVECEGATVSPASLEALACARDVSVRLGAEVVAVLIAPRLADLVPVLSAGGAQRIVHAAVDWAGDATVEARVDALCQLLASRRPRAVLGPWSSACREWLPRVAARLGLGMTGDAVGLDVGTRPGDPDTLDLVWLKPAWSGSATARVVARTVPAFGTLRPGSVRASAGAPAAVPVERIVIAASASPRAPWATPPELGGTQGPAGAPATPRVDGALRLVLVGGRLDRGSARRAPLLADQLGAAVAGTRAAAALGLVDPAAEISVLKRSMAPALVVALGLDGAGDLVALRAATSVVVVDERPASEVHDAADLSVVVPAAEFLDAMLSLQVPPASRA